MKCKFTVYLSFCEAKQNVCRNLMTISKGEAKKIELKKYKNGYM